MTTAHARKLQQAGWRLCRRRMPAPNRWQGAVIPTRQVVVIGRHLSAPAAARWLREAVRTTAPAAVS